MDTGRWYTNTLVNLDAGSDYPDLYVGLIVGWVGFLPFPALSLRTDPGPVRSEKGPLKFCMGRPSQNPKFKAHAMVALSVSSLQPCLTYIS